MNVELVTLEQLVKASWRAGQGTTGPPTDREVKQLTDAWYATQRALLSYAMAETVLAPDPSVDEELQACVAGRDGDCTHGKCPQLRDGEPEKTGRHCPVDRGLEKW